MYFLGNAAKTAFTNLRTRYARDCKKIRKVKVSGTSTDGVTEATDEASELFPFLSWLHPFIKPRKTSGNLVSVDNSENEDTDNEGRPPYEKLSEESSTTGNDENMSDGSNSFKSKKKIKLPKTKNKLNQEAVAAEIQVLQSIGAAIGKTTNTNDRSQDEDEIFGALITSQLRQIPQEKKILIKMQITNMLYQEMLSSLPMQVSTSASVPLAPQQDTTWRCLPQYQQRCSPESNSGNQSVRRAPFQIPSVEQSSNEQSYRPGELFYRNNRSFLGELNDN